MPIFVVNEWLPEDSSGANNSEAQRTALKVVELLANSLHQIVVIEDSQFEKKFYALTKNNTNVTIRGIARIYMMSLRFNSDRCIAIKAENASPIPPELAAATKNDDHYLLHALLTIPDSTLVTTDADLRAAVEAAGLPCLSREQFLSDVLGIIA
ncbi:MAG: hypothetical protein WAJ96_04200 [Candidatus Acidiferrum sp.]